MTRKPTAPTYDLYRGKYARVVIDRQSIHLGTYGSEKSHQKYRELVAAWLSKSPAEEDPKEFFTVAEVLEAYREHALDYYGDGRDSRYSHLLPTIRSVREMYADMPAHEFTPKKLKRLRESFVGAGHCRKHVNAKVQQVVGIFEWAASEELVPGSLVHDLKTVKSLRKGHTTAPEGKTVEAVAQERINATLPHLTPILADMVRLQLISGCRPGELCRLTPGQIDRSGDVWVYIPGQHKNAHRGHERIICFGPKSQDVLRKYLLRPDDAPCFSPKESMAQFFDQQHDARKTPMSCGNKPRPGGRDRAIARVRTQYDVAGYRRAIERACDRAGVPRWTPHRLRHTRAEEVREVFGLDGSQAILGHKHARTTEIYAAIKKEKAIEIARSVG